MACLANTESLAGHPNTRATLGHGPLCQLAPARRAYHFFSVAFETISALSYSSIYIFFSRRFFSSGLYWNFVAIPFNCGSHLTGSPNTPFSLIPQQGNFMLYSLLPYWPFFAVLAVLFGAGGKDSPSSAMDDWQDEWAAHPMNKEGLNWKGD